MDRKVNSYDVARAAGVSRSAVSLVLNGRADGVISAANQQAVREAAQRLGYRPNRVARSLRNQATHTIGVITDMVSGPFGGEMISQATLKAAEHDYLLLVIDALGESSEPDIKRNEKEAIEALLARQVDGLLVAAGYLREWSPVKAFWQAPGILLDAFDPDEKATGVVSDEENGGYQATQMLLDAGHRRIAVLTGNKGQAATIRRLAGHRRAMKQAGLECPEVTCGWEINDGLREGYRLMNSSEPPTGIVCANDRVAAGVIVQAARLGIRIPEDLSLVGYDDDPNIAIQLGISTVQLPHRAMGEKAMEMMLSAIQGKEAAPGEVLVPTPVIRRESIKEPTSTS